jgi:hypothetical protein
MSEKTWEFIFKLFSFPFSGFSLWTMEIDIKNLDASLIEKFKNKNYEYTQPFNAYIVDKYHKYLSYGFVVVAVLSIMRIMLFGELFFPLPPAIAKFKSPPFPDDADLTDKIGIIIVYIVSMYFAISALFSSLMRSKTLIKINQDGIHLKYFFNKKCLLTWQEIKDVKQTYYIGGRGCILILKNRNIFERYVTFLTKKHPLGWKKEVDEVCKFIKFKIEEVNKSDVQVGN